MKILNKFGKEDVALVYLAETNGKFIEFVESVEPGISRADKWVLIVSTLSGCPVGCPMCDVGGWYKGKLSKDEIMGQIDYMVGGRFGSDIPVNKFKIQFARLGEPSFNPAVIDVLEELGSKYNAPGLMPCISTIAPSGSEEFFERLLLVKDKFKSFQLQFSIHTTDVSLRDKIIPVPKWSFSKIAEYGKRFFSGGRKITLNFALAKGSALDADVLFKYFDPSVFLIKLTPVNPTISAKENNVVNAVDVGFGSSDVVSSLRSKGYDVIVSIGELEENQIGSNCGQFVRKYLDSEVKKEGIYAYVKVPSQ